MSPTQGSNRAGQAGAVYLKLCCIKRLHFIRYRSNYSKKKKNRHIPPLAPEFGMCCLLDAFTGQVAVAGQDDTLGRAAKVFVDHLPCPPPLSVHSMRQEQTFLAHPTAAPFFYSCDANIGRSSFSKACQGPLPPQPSRDMSCFRYRLLRTPQCGMTPSRTPRRRRNRLTFVSTFFHFLRDPPLHIPNQANCSLII